VAPIRLALLTALLALPAASARATTLAALGDDGSLLVFAADRPADVRRVRLTGLDGVIVGIDVRPANGRLYALTTSNDVFTIDQASGAATLVSTLTVPFTGGRRSGVDFNPQSDRLRLVSAEGQNLRVNVDIGATATDAALSYSPTDRNAGKRPAIAAAAYTNNVAGAATTKLFEIDAAEDVLVLQDPPNDGVLVTIGPLGVDFAREGGFDVVTDGGGVDHAFAASGTTLYTVDLGTGRATSQGTIGAGDVRVVGLTALTR
jgi:hypothetical protein